MLGYANDIAASSLSLDGAVRNLDVRESVVGTYVMQFAHDGDTAANTHTFHVYEDLRPVASVTPGGIYISDPHGEIAVDVSVHFVRTSQAGPLELAGEVMGDRVFLDWGAVADLDVSEYRVHWDNGTGTLNMTAAGLVGTVDQIAIQRVDSIGPTSGGGTGLVSVGGIWRGATINATCAVVILAGGLFGLDYGAGVVGDGWEIIQDITIHPVPGLSVSINSAPATYTEGARYEFHIGPKTDYLTDALGTGDWKFAILAVDSAGNTSPASNIKSVSTVAQLTPPVSPAVSWAAATGEITVTWTAPADAAVQDVAVYTNYNDTVDALGDYVEEDNPIAIVAVATGGHIITPAAAARGEFLFYLRSRDALSNQENNAVLLRVTAEDVPASDLIAPVIESATASAGGTVTLIIRIDRSDGDAASIKVYASLTDDWAGASVVETVAFDETGSFPIALQEWVSVGTYAANTYFGAELVDSGGAISERSALVMVTPDNDPPAAPVLETAVAV